MARLIDADELIKSLSKYAGFTEKIDLNAFIKEIDNAPTIYPICEDKACKYRANERPQGEWTLNKDENPECPFCHHSFTYWGSFCGNCGADMR